MVVAAMTITGCSGSAGSVETTVSRPRVASGCSAGAVGDGDRNTPGAPTVDAALHEHFRVGHLDYRLVTGDEREVTIEFDKGGGRWTVSADVARGEDGWRVINTSSCRYER
jgi:hypothetical protein